MTRLPQIEDLSGLRLFDLTELRKFLSTSGGMGEALNVGFFAVKPDRRLVDAAVP